ncbi:IclR family transcriptional regulator, KDG regulon repressor [Marmoricola sp. URHA0025 HA25]
MAKNEAATVRVAVGDVARKVDRVVAGIQGREIRPVQALVHAVEVLEALAVHGEMGVSELSREVGLSKTAVYNILGTFEGTRFVRRDPGSSRYRLGWRLHEMGTLVSGASELSPVATRPLLEELALSTRESVLLGIRDRNGVTYVDRVESDRPLRMVASPGRQNPLHATASGKVLLAHELPEFVEEVLASGLPAYTAKTITDPDRLRMELKQVAEQGYALCIQEREADLSSIGVPVRDYTGHVVAALSIAAPALRLEDQTVRDSVLADMRVTAEKLESHLGAHA